MPAPLQWPAEVDAMIVRERESGLSWDDIAAAAGCSRFAVSKRGTFLLGETRVRRTAGPEGLGQRSADPLPAGHEYSWGVISKEPWPCGS